MVETISSLRAAQRLSDLWQGKDQKLSIMLQVNISNEERNWCLSSVLCLEKGGCKTTEVVDLYDQISKECNNLNVKGLMTIGKYGYDPSEGINPDFMVN